jgi:twitching motility protein PilT
MESKELHIQDYLEAAVVNNASDVHLAVGKPPTLRIDGALRSIEGQVALTAPDVETLVGQLIDAEQKKLLDEAREIDFSFAYGDVGRFRVNAFHQRGVLAAALRLIPSKIRTIEELGLPAPVGTFTEFSRGLVLFTGPAGSGKSTSLAALIERINQTKAVHVITIEDPIEYNHTSAKAIIDQREVHYDTLSFGHALRSAMRQDPDVILVGEMRDLETISSAVTLAETGHLVFGTIHTNSSAQTIDRIVDVFPPHQQQQIRIQLAATLQAIVAQRLVPAIGGGRIVAAEILKVNAAVRNLIRESKTHQLDAVMQTGAAEGMQTLDKDLARLVHAGKITLEEGKNFCLDLAEFTRLAT